MPNLDAIVAGGNCGCGDRRRSPLSFATRFWLPVWPRGDCWERRGRGLDAQGYARIWTARSNRQELAHRVAFELAYGFAPAVESHHLCQHKWCVRPSHLTPVTYIEHRAADRGRQTHCKHGHAFDIANTYWRKPRPNKGWNGRRECRRCHADQEIRRMERLHG